MFETKAVAKIETRILYSTNFLKIVPFIRQCGNVW